MSHFAKSISFAFTILSFDLRKEANMTAISHYLDPKTSIRVFKLTETSGSQLQSSLKSIERHVTR